MTTYEFDNGEVHIILSVLSEILHAAEASVIEVHDLDEIRNVRDHIRFGLSPEDRLHVEAMPNLIA